MGKQYEKRTDLAIEVRESFPEDDVEISGVILEKKDFDQKKTTITTVKICNENGAKQMKKPMGTYITLEFKWERELEDNKSEYYKNIVKHISDIMEKMCFAKTGKKSTILISGLGNRFATPDALGPFVIENIQMNRHFFTEFGDLYEEKKDKMVCGISPGVMSQTGMESREILEGIIKEIKPDYLIVIDALASSSVKRLCTTIQITDTGISPGAGIGNNRNQINQETMSTPVIAVGVPTVVDASTIVYETLETALQKEGYSEREINTFFRSINKEVGDKLFVTPKDIDEKIHLIGEMISEGINLFVTK